MTDHTLAISIAGITVSGVVGPTATSWITRASDRRRFVRDREGARRDELLVLVDEAATLLALGPVRLRQDRAHRKASTQASEEQRLWPENVYAVGQRLRLRLGRAHEVVRTYDLVRDQLTEAGTIGLTDPDSEAHDNAILRFEDARERFLEAARRAVDAPVKEKERRS